MHSDMSAGYKSKKLETSLQVSTTNLATAAGLMHRKPRQSAGFFRVPAKSPQSSRFHLLHFALRGSAWYKQPMTKLMDQAIAAVSKLPDEKQDQLASMIIEAAVETPYQLSDDERAAVEDGLADIKAGRYASDEEISNLFNRFRTA